MNLQEIEQAGGFVSVEPFPATIKWKDKDGKDKDYEIFIRRLSFGDVENLAMAGDSTKAHILGASILLGAANEPMGLDKAKKLDPVLANRMLEAWATVNQAKNS